MRRKYYNELLLDIRKDIIFESKIENLTIQIIMSAIIFMGLWVKLAR
jgi:hypothetical protein